MRQYSNIKTASIVSHSIGDVTDFSSPSVNKEIARNIVVGSQNPIPVNFFCLQCLSTGKETQRYVLSDILFYTAKLLLLRVVNYKF
jgi:hypothetical protein